MSQPVPHALSRARRAPVALVAGLSVVAAGLVAATPATAAPSSGLVVSRVYGGGGNAGAPFTNDYVEIFNRGTTAASLADMSVQYASATGTGNFGGSASQLTELPAAMVPAGGYFLVQEAGGATGAALPTPDHVDPTPISMSAAAGKVVLARGATTLGCNGGSTPCAAEQTGRIVDLVGYGAANYSETAPTAAPSNTTDAARRSAGCTETDSNAADFEIVAPAPRNTASPLHSCGGADQAPLVASSDPAGGDSGVSTDTSVTVTFSEPVAATGDWATLACSTSGAHVVDLTGGPTTYTLDPTQDLATDENCTVTVHAAQVTDLDTVDPPDAMASDDSFTFSTVEADPCDTPFTPIHDIQGSGGTNTANNQTRTTEGVVVGDFQRGTGMNGLFIQDPDADSDPRTSEGVFVFVPAASPFFGLDLEAGDAVHLRGRVTEFQNQTEIDNVDQLVVCGSGTGIPATEVTLPEATNGDLERYEGMKVTLPQTMTVEQNFFQGRFGQLTLGAGGRLFQPTNQFPAGSTEARALADRNSRSLIVLDDASSAQNRSPVPFLGADGIRRAGDSVSGIAGILDEGAINSNTTIRDYRVQVTSQPTFSQDNARTAAPEAVGGNLTVASFNVLNYFTTLTSQDPDARGADTAEEFTRQRTKIFSAMQAINADVFGLMEIENRPSPNATQNLVEGLNEYIRNHGGPADSYAAVPNPATGTGDDFIKVAMIYKPAKVTLVGASRSDPDEINSRPPLAQTFELKANGEKLSVVVNHLKSKGSCPSGTSDPGNADNGDGQGCWNALRVQQADRLLAFIDAVQAAAGDDDVLAIGDFNAYGKEDPILALQAGGMKNEIERYVGPDAYSYVFDGLSGYLDHGLATDSADGQVVGATEWHINADEPSVIDYNTEFKPDDRYAPTPYRSSDHDPVVLGVELGRCQFSDDSTTRTRTLLGDCTTSETVRVKDEWTLDGDGHTITAYDPEGSWFKGAVVANEGHVANVRNLTVTTRNLTDHCDGGADALRGILLDGANGSITHNAVTGLKQSGNSGCQEGNAIEVRNDPLGTAGPDTTVDITDNTVTDYQKTGILANGSVVATIGGNTVHGAGPVDYIAQNGVQVSRGATATVDGNAVADNSYTGADVACGLLFYQADGIRQKRNTFSGNERDVCNVGRGGGDVSPNP